MMADPHSLIEGCIITCYAIRANFCAIYVRGEALHPLRRVRYAVERGVREGLPGPATSSAPGSTSTSSCTPAPAPTSAARRRRCSTRWRAAAGSRGSSRRSRPPRASTPRRPWSTTSRPSPRVPAIVQRRQPTGSARWAARRAPARRSTRCPGTSTRPGQYEAPMGTTLRELLELAGGMKDGIPLKFWTPGGSSTPLFTAEHLDVPLDFEGAAEAGSMLGTTAAADLQRDGVGAVGGHEVDRVLQARVLRQVHAVPGGHLLAAADPASGWCTARAPPRTSTPCSTSATTSSAARSARSVTARRSPITSGIKYFRQEFLDLCTAQPRSHTRTSCPN